MANLTLNKNLDRFIATPHDPMVCVDVANNYFAINQYGAALSYYLRAAELTEDDTLAYYCLLRNALIFRKQGRREGSFKNQMWHAITLCPKRPEGYLLLCKYYFEKGRNHECNMMATMALNVCEEFYSNDKLDFPGKYALIFHKAVSAYAIAKFTESRTLLTELRDWPEPLSPEYQKAVDINLDKLKIPRNMDNINFENEYLIACKTPSDINEHLPMLNALAMECKSVTEMGVRHGMSTRAFMLAGKKLTSYDLELDEGLKPLFAKYPLGEYIQADVLLIEIEQTDLLFIDTWHHYDQLKEELKLHAPKVNKYIAMHDTHTFGIVGENMPVGLLPAMLEFLAANPEWRVKYHTTRNNGLTVLEKIKPNAK
jgi:tetratricopeptide (TPR) repeat protein